MERWWPLRFFQRLAYTANLIIAPMLMTSLMMEIVFAAVIATGLGLGVGIATKAIPDTTTAAILKTLGGRVTDILQAQKVY